MTKTGTFSLMALMAAVVAVAPAQAQKGHGRGHDQRSEARRDDDRDDDRRSNDRRFTRRNSRRVPPGWCRGVGNPHNTAANCGYNTDRIYRDRDGSWRDRYGNVIRRDGIYRDRNGTVRDRYGRVIGSRTGTVTSNRGSYSERHTEFHRRQRAECNARAENASIRDRVVILRQCTAEHDAWHRREGIAH